ncbi:MAG: hypothetical protein ABW221_23865 [Vicinamibacteria bacterium]
MVLSNWALFFLALIAALSVAQTVTLILLAKSGLRTQRELAVLGKQISRDLSPMIDDLTRIARNAAEVSDRGLVQVQRLDAAIGDAARTLDDIMGTTRQVVLPVAGRLAAVTAGYRAFKTGRSIVRRFLG